MLITIISWIMTGLTIVGTVLNSFQKKAGFIFWLISNLFWTYINVQSGLYAQAAVYVFNSVMCLVGIVQWKKRDREVKSDNWHRY